MLPQMHISLNFQYLMQLLELLQLSLPKNKAVKILLYIYLTNEFDTKALICTTHKRITAKPISNIMKGMIYQKRK